MREGAFVTSREIFDNPIWKNIVEFRLFTLIYGNAVFSEDGVRMAEDLTLHRGQWLRSTRKLQEDLIYIENRQVKKYSTATINRTVKKLVDMQRVCTKTHELGTVFTVINYEQYQGFGNYRKKELGTELGTVAKQSRNNNNYVKNDKNVSNNKPSSRNNKKHYSEDSTYFKMASYFYEKVKSVAEENELQHLTIKADIQKWSDDMRKLVEIDKQDMQLVEEVVNWVTHDPFWKTNVLSAGKLREKFPDLAIKMKTSTSIRNDHNKYSSKSDKSKKVLQEAWNEIENNESKDKHIQSRDRDIEIQKQMEGVNGEPTINLDE